MALGGLDSYTPTGHTPYCPWLSAWIDLWITRTYSAFILYYHVILSFSVYLQEYRLQQAVLLHLLEDILLYAVSTWLCLLETVATPVL